MTSCTNNRKLIAWLAVGAIDANGARELVHHIKTCAGCRAYLEEMSHLTKKLEDAKVKFDFQPSATFHQQLVRRLRAEESAPIWERLVAYVQVRHLNWRIVLPVAVTLIVMIATVFSAINRRAASPLAQNRNQAAPAGKPAEDLAPTMSNYQMIANRSLEKLDELLSREGTRNASSAPAYTASMLTQAKELE